MKTSLDKQDSIVAECTAFKREHPESEIKLSDFVKVRHWVLSKEKKYHWQGYTPSAGGVIK